MRRSFRGGGDEGRNKLTLVGAGGWEGWEGEGGIEGRETGEGGGGRS